MVLSMTGYGRAEQERSGRDITVEIKSVNSRYFEYTSRMPRSFAFLDDKLKKLLSAAVSRGKVELSLQMQAVSAPDVTVQVNMPLAKSYAAALEAIRAGTGAAGDVTAGLLARFPDVLAVRHADVDEDALWQDVAGVCQAALQNFIAMRAVEGEKLKADVMDRLAAIEQTVGKIEEGSAQRVENYTQKLYARLETILQDQNIDQARILTEAAIFADKTAVDEETVRLRSHVAQLRTMLESDEPMGRKMDFLIQEVNRESNTIGSKCCDVAIAQVVVGLKAEVEKMREQVQNVE